MSSLKPQKGMFRKFRGIRTIIDSVDEHRYRKMLPKAFEPHETPLITLFIADYIKVFPWPMTRYQEGAAFLNCRYRGKAHWYVYTMPVTKRVPMQGGRQIGYPKYIADEIFLRRENGAWIGNVIHKNRCKLCLSFSTGLDRDPREPEKIWVMNKKSLFLGKSIVLCPPGEGPAIKTTIMEHKVNANWNPNYGMVKVDMDAKEPLDGLFDKEKKYVGMYNEFTGGINIIPQQLN